MSEPVKIRQLKRKDRRIVAGMIRKIVEKPEFAGLVKMISADVEAERTEVAKAEKDTTFQKIGIDVVKILLDVLEDDVTKWFADLIGVTAEQFDDQDLDVEVQIIDQLVQAEESNRFFTGALRLSKSMQGLAGQFSTAKVQ